MKLPNALRFVCLFLMLSLLLTACDLDVPTTTPPPALTPLSCAHPPTGSFLSIWQGDLSLQAALGCPTSNHPRLLPEAWEVAAAVQPFESGVMLWSDHIGWYEQAVIYVIYADGTYQRFDDTYDPAVDPASGGETPPAGGPTGLLEPVNGFGKLWRTEASVRAALGWATAAESGGTGRFLLFERGDMIWVSPTDETTVFTGGQATVYNVPFVE